MNFETIRLWKNTLSGLLVFRNISAITARLPYCGDSSCGSAIAPTMLMLARPSPIRVAVATSTSVG